MKDKITYFKTKFVVFVLFMIIGLVFVNTHKYFSLKTYSNPQYGFSFKYPKTYSLTNIDTTSQYYQTISVLTANNRQNIFINSIQDVDIYENTQIYNVAFREIMDSAYESYIKQTKLNGYDLAITTTVKNTLYTLKHPNKNLYIIFNFPNPIDQENIDIVTSFKFETKSKFFAK